MRWSHSSVFSTGAPARAYGAGILQCPLDTWKLRLWRWSGRRNPVSSAGFFVLKAMAFSCMKSYVLLGLLEAQTQFVSGFLQAQSF